MKRKILTIGIIVIFLLMSFSVMLVSGNGLLTKTGENEKEENKENGAGSTITIARFYFGINSMNAVIVNNYDSPRDVRIHFGAAYPVGGRGGKTTLDETIYLTLEPGETKVSAPYYDGIRVIIPLSVGVSVYKNPGGSTDWYLSLIHI